MPDSSLYLKYLKLSPYLLYFSSLPTEYCRVLIIHIYSAGEATFSLIHDHENEIPSKDFQAFPQSLIINSVMVLKQAVTTPFHG
jgi:hypothetical protein